MREDANFLFLVTLIFFIVVLILRLIFPILWKRYTRRQRIRATMLMIHARGDEFDNYLQKHNRFYRHLSVEERKRFLQRAVEFMKAKKFIYYELARDERIALLVSAAAIQITFGLDFYLLDFFEDIHILRNDYHYGGYNMAFMGHVNSKGIYFSWYNFLKGFEDHTDANNVGLHEMAHALAYVNFVVKSGGEDPEFKKRFEDFSSIGRPIFEKMQGGLSTVLDKYAATDFQEFWAVCVETFFEKPKELKSRMPELYHAIAMLLNIDPLANEVVVKEVA